MEVVGISLFISMKRLILSVMIFCFCIVNLTFAKTYDLSEVSKAKLVTEYSKDTVVDDMDTVTFGSYPQSDASGNTKEPIEWIVLDRQGNKVLLLSKYILDCKSYNNTNVDITWENCTLREWLNDTFINIAFNNNEQNCIETTHINNNDFISERGSSISIISAGNDTNDKIFCISVDELKNYFKQENFFTYNKRLSTNGTDYAINVINGGYNLPIFDFNDLSSNPNAEFCLGNSSFWLRSPGSTENRAANVDSRGWLDATGDIVDGIGSENPSGYYVSGNNKGVRPALWIDTSMLKSAQLLNNSSVRNDSINTFSSTDINIGKEIQFGHYNNYVNGNNEELTWNVIDIQNNKALLFSKYVIDKKPYANGYANWEDSSLRTWLNNNFYNVAFNDNEKQAIEIRYLNHEDVSPAPGITVLKQPTGQFDYIYLLDRDEIKNYFGITQEQYFVGNDLLTCFDTNLEKTSWWIRANNMTNTYNSAMDAGGYYITEYGSEDNFMINWDQGVRPAVWVDIDKLTYIINSSNTIKNNINDTTDNRINEISNLEDNSIILKKSDVKKLQYQKKKDGFLGLFGNVHYYVNIELKNDVKAKFKEITTNNINSIVNIIKDNGVLISYATIKSAISNGKFNIESNSLQKVKDIFNELKNADDYYFILSKNIGYTVEIGREAIKKAGYNLTEYNIDSFYIIGLPSVESEFRDNKFYLNNDLQKRTWVYYLRYYYHVDDKGNIEKSKWIEGRYVGDDGKMYTSRRTPDGKWVGEDGLEVGDVGQDLENSLLVKEAQGDSWYKTELGLWYYFENDRTTTKKGWFLDNRDDQWYYLDPNTGIMAVGWTNIDGALYYFNEFASRETNWYEVGDGFYESYGKKIKAFGSLFMNEYTPDGHFVDSDGKLVY